MQFTFYGYADIATECMAACKVDGGPTYRIRLRGEASNVQYKFSHKTIDFGQQVYTYTCTNKDALHGLRHFQLYSQVVTSELVLYNTGKVDMDFTALGVAKDNELRPGEISVQPAMVRILH